MNEMRKDGLGVETPRVPSSPDEVRFAAGLSIPYKNSRGETVGPFRVLHTLNRAAGVWSSACIDHLVFTETVFGASLADAQAMICEEIRFSLNEGTFLNLVEAPADEIRLWGEIHSIGKKPSDFGNAAEIMSRITSAAAPPQDYPAESPAANSDLAMAA